MHRWGLSLSCLLVVGAATACSRDSAPPTTADRPLPVGLTLEALPLPAPEGSAHPQLTASPRGAVLSWLEQQDETSTLRFSERTSAGWSEARKVASGDDWFVTAADVPSVLRLRNGTLVANWYPATDPSSEAYDTKLSYSTDDGKTWAAPFSPHHDKTKTQHGFVSMLELSSGGVGLVWLDGREQELNTTDPLGGSMALYYASFDPSWKQTSESLVNARVCECCQTAVAATSSGLVAAFRDRSDQEIRDIKISRLDADKWSPEIVLHNDNWKIDACPINGPALSARGREVAVAWFTAPGDDGRAFAAFSDDAGQSWSQPIRLDDQGSIGRVDIELLDDGSAAASWMEFADGKSQFKVRRVTSSGARSEALAVPGAARVGGYARMTRAGDEIVLAWTDNENGQKVKGAVARISRTTAP